MRVDEALRAARERLAPGEAEWLLAHVLGRNGAWLYAHGDAEIDTAAFGALVERRAAGEPVAYLTGRRGFWTLELTVGPDTLIPRADTERLVELALERLPAGPCRVADLGTGSGAIALAIASERRDARIVATDASGGALAIARVNRDALQLHRVELRLGDWCDALGDDTFDLIASNPPYIEAGDAHLAQGDLRFEPAGALASGADGLDAIRRITRDAPRHLVPGGWLLLEHGHAQGPAVRGLLAAAGFVDVATFVDIEGRDRVSLGRCAA